MIVVWIKWIFTGFLAFLLPVNWIIYGPGNILWFSDISLIFAYLALIFESRLLASMAAIQGLIFESAWVISFLVSLVYTTDYALTSYMHDPTIPLWIRCLSLFHLFLPAIFVWLILRLGYTKKALPIQIGISWVVILLTWLFTSPSKNINFIFSYEKLGMSPLPYLLLFSIGMAFVLVLTHFLLSFINKFRKT